MSQGWNKLFSRINWLNRPSKATSLGATNLNKGDFALDEIDNRVIQLDTTKADMNVVNGMVSDVSLNESNGVITITYKDGSTKTYDTNLEKIAVNFDYDSETERLILTMPDGTTQYVDLSALITQFEFADSDTIAFSVDSSGKVSASIKNGSITEAMLETGYLANIKVEVAKAEAASSQAQSSETSSDYNAKLSRSYAIGGSGIREGEDTDNAMYYYEQAKKTDVGQIRSEVDELNSNIVELKENSTIVKKSVGKFINDKGTLDGKAKLVNLHHNLLNPTLLTETTKNGITCTPNTDADGNFDGTYTLNGTASANALFDIAIVKLNAGTYRLIGCPSGGSSKTYWFYAYIYSSYGEYGSGCNIKAKNDGDNATVKIVINSGATVENLVFKPMITDDLTATYDDFVPYESYEVKSFGRNICGGLDFANVIKSTGLSTVNLDETAETIRFQKNNSSNRLNNGFFPWKNYPFKENTQYTFILTGFSNTDTDNSNLYILYTDGTNLNFVLGCTEKQTKVFVSAEGKTIEKMQYIWMTDKYTTLYYNECGIFEGVLTEDDFIPYVSDTVTVTQDTTEAWLDTYEGETNILAPLSVTAMYGTNLQGNEIMTDLYESDNEVAKLKNDLGGLSFSVSGTTLSITDGTNTWSLSN